MGNGHEADRGAGAVAVRRDDGVNDRAGTVGGSAVSEGAAILSMIERAARDPAVDVDKMERLFMMQQQAADRRAKSDYLAAFSALQSELPAIEKRGKGHGAQKFAKFEDVVGKIKGPLAKHGFSLSFRLEHGEKTIGVIGVLGHAGGHSEETKIVLQADKSGSKNDVQAWGSSVSYGKRYVSLTLLGIATEDEDDDGKAVGRAASITDGQAIQLRDLIEATGTDEAAFCKYMGAEKLSQLAAKDFDRALVALKKKASKR